MMRCPYCSKDISDTAVRCRFCRKPIRSQKRRSLKDIIDGTKKILLSGRDPISCPWSFLDVVLITVLISVFVFHDPFRLSRRVMDFLRLHFFIFTKEPKLFYYLAVYINTIVLKFISLILVVLLVNFRKASFWGSVVSIGRLSRSNLRWLPVYMVICAVFRLMSVTNPLAPHIPLNSVFFEALIIGNFVIIFSLLFVAPFVEEVLFRGFIYPAFNKYIGIYPSIILTSILFTLAHYPHIRNEYLFMSIIFTLGLMMTYAKAKTGSTWLAILMHHVYNLVYVGIGFIMYAVVKY